MDYLKPAEVVAAMIDSGARKAELPVNDLLIRGALSGAILGIATSLAITTQVQTGVGVLGAVIFPVGFVMIVLLGLELVTGSFALLPLACIERRIGLGALLRNWGWVFAGNLIGSMAYAVLFWIALTMMGTMAAGPVGERVAALADAKTLLYASHGAAGVVTSFVKAALCNWMVCMGVVMGMLAQSTVSKVVAAWIPILVFFAHGYEHAVVNMFLIPAGMLFGAKTSTAEWWLWNQVPVTLGNLAGGFLFTGLALYLTYRSRGVKVAPAGSTVGVPTL